MRCQDLKHRSPIFTPTPQPTPRPTLPGPTEPPSPEEWKRLAPTSAVPTWENWLEGLRDRSTAFDGRLLASLPHLKETSVENFITQVELMYERPEHRVLRKCAYIQMEARDGVPLSWDVMRMALLSTRKRAGAAALLEYQQFRQSFNESIIRAWTRFVGLAKTAEVCESKATLWNYFRGRLTQEAKLLFRTELSERDPYMALAKIADAGDVPIQVTNARILAFGEPESTPGVRCFGCGGMGHRIRFCPNPSSDRPRSAAISPS